MTGGVGLYYCDVLVASGFACCQVGDFKGAGHFKAEFKVKELRFAPISMTVRRGIIMLQHCRWTFSHKETNLCSRLNSTDIEFYFKI